MKRIIKGFLLIFIAYVQNCNSFQNVDIIQGQYYPESFKHSEENLGIDKQLWDPIKFSNVEETIYISRIHTAQREIIDEQGRITDKIRDSPLLTKIKHLINESDKIVIFALNLNLHEIIDCLVDKLIANNNFKLEIFLNGHLVEDDSWEKDQQREFYKFINHFNKNLSCKIGNKKELIDRINTNTKIYGVAKQNQMKQSYQKSEKNYKLFHHKKMIFYRKSKDNIFDKDKENRKDNDDYKISHIIDGSANFTLNGFNGCSDSTSLKKFHSDDSQKLEKLIQYIKKDILSDDHYEYKINDNGKIMSCHPTSKINTKRQNLKHNKRHRYDDDSTEQTTNKREKK